MAVVKALRHFKKTRCFLGRLQEIPKLFIVFIEVRKKSLTRKAVLNKGLTRLLFQGVSGRGTSLNGI